MKLDDEMRAAAIEAWNAAAHPTACSAAVAAVFAAGCRMGLERAARKCEGLPMSGAALSQHVRYWGDGCKACAAAIRKMAHD
jgi:hypothetical protein